jgi:hypothetical protein
MYRDDIFFSKYLFYLLIYYDKRESHRSDYIQFNVLGIGSLLNSAWISTPCRQACTNQTFQARYCLLFEIVTNIVLYLDSIIVDKLIMF